MSSGLSKIARLLGYLRDRGVKSWSEQLSVLGRDFLITERYLKLAKNESLQLYLSDPSNSGLGYGVTFTPRASRETLIDVSRGDVTEESQGEPVRVANARERSDRDFSGIARIATPDNGGAYTHAAPEGDRIIEDGLPGTGKGAASEGQTVSGFGVGISEGSDLLIELTNESGGTASLVTFKVEVLELDASVVTNDIDPDDLTDW